MVFFEVCGLVSAVIPVTDVFFFISSHFLVVVFSALCLSVTAPEIREISKIFLALNAQHIFAQLVFTSSCILWLYAYPNVTLFAGILAGFNFIRISVYALEQILFAKCKLRSLF